MTELFRTFSPGPFSTDNRQPTNLQLGKHLTEDMPCVSCPSMSNPSINSIQFKHLNTVHKGLENDNAIV